MTVCFSAKLECLCQTRQVKRGVPSGSSTTAESLHSAEPTTPKFGIRDKEKADKAHCADAALVAIYLCSYYYIYMFFSFFLPVNGLRKYPSDTKLLDHLQVAKPAKKGK